MPFVNADMSGAIKGPRALSGLCHLSLLQATEKGSRVPTFYMVIREPLMDRLEWNVGDYLWVQEGTGRDAGFLQFVPANPGSVAIRLSSAGSEMRPREALARFQVTRLRTYQATVDKAPMAEVAHQAFNHQFQIMCPPWLVPKVAPGQIAAPAPPLPSPQFPGI